MSKKRKIKKTKNYNKKAIKKFKSRIPLIMLSIIWIGILGLIYLIYLFIDLPDLEQAKLINHKTIKFYDRHNQLVTQYGTLQNRPLAYSEVPINIIYALLATEDNNFFMHNGLDIIAIARAAITNLISGRKLQGGSTITQQLAKIIYLNADKTFKRKLQELILAFYLEHKYSKEEIISTYLNNAYFGSGIYGIAGASKYYFSKDLSQLNLLESAMLVGMLKAPNKYNPICNPDLSTKRTKQILKNMLNAEFIEQDDYEYWSNQPIILETLYERNTNIMYFTDFILEKYQDMIDGENVVEIKTYLDLRINKKIEKIINNKNFRNSLKEHDVSQLAILVINRQGQVISYIGGMDYLKSSFNRISKMKRQSGSLFKLFTYLEAFEQGYSDNDIIEDKYIKIGNWIPRNFNRYYHGDISIKEAFAKSLNSAAVILTEKIGRKKVMNMAKSLGIESKLQNYPSLALGTDLMTLEELTRAYNIIANQCRFVDLRYIDSINNNSIMHIQGFKHSCTERAADYMDKLLKYNMQYGTGKNLKIINSAGKSGTTNDYKDAWFIGYDDQYAIGVWMGNDDNKSMKNVTGGSLPAKLWSQVINAIYE